MQIVESLVTTCVILNYNDSNRVKTLLHDIAGYNSLTYIIVVDNCSSDNSYEELKKCESDKIKVLLSDKNGGYGYGNNLGVKYSYDILSANYVLISNPDVKFSESVVVALIDAFKRHIECGLIAPTWYDRGYPVAWKFPTITQDILRASILLNHLYHSGMLYPMDYFKNKNEVYVDSVSGSLLMVDANIMINYGMYDEDFFLYEEEKILGYKLKSAGYASLMLLNHTYLHEHSASINKTIGSLVKSKRLLLRSKLLYLSKYKHIGNLTYFFAFVFFKICELEMYLISIIKKISK